MDDREFSRFCAENGLEPVRHNMAPMALFHSLAGVAKLAAEKVAALEALAPLAAEKIAAVEAPAPLPGDTVVSQDALFDTGWTEAFVPPLGTFVRFDMPFADAPLSVTVEVLDPRYDFLVAGECCSALGALTLGEINRKGFHARMTGPGGQPVSARIRYTATGTPMSAGAQIAYLRKQLKRRLRAGSVG